MELDTQYLQTVKMREIARAPGITSIGVGLNLYTRERVFLISSSMRQNGNWSDVEFNVRWMGKDFVRCHIHRRGQVDGQWVEGTHQTSYVKNMYSHEHFEVFSTSDGWGGKRKSKDRWPWKSLKSATMCDEATWEHYFEAQLKLRYGTHSS